MVNQILFQIFFHFWKFFSSCPVSPALLGSMNWIYLICMFKRIARKLFFVNEIYFFVCRMMGFVWCSLFLSCMRHFILTKIWNSRQKWSCKLVGFQKENWNMQFTFTTNIASFSFCSIPRNMCYWHASPLISTVLPIEDSEDTVDVYVSLQSLYLLYKEAHYQFNMWCLEYSYMKSLYLSKVLLRWKECYKTINHRPIGFCCCAFFHRRIDILHMLRRMHTFEANMNWVLAIPFWSV